jgi:hypothetical protein
MRKTLVVMGLAVSSVASAQTFKAFTPVQSVCPTCTTGPHYDRVVLRDGSDVKAVVAAENDKYYVLMKYGELRAVGKDQVQTVEKNPGADHSMAFPDQVLQRDGTVLAGTLKSDGDPLVITVPISGTDHTVFRSEVASAHKGGKQIVP